jgi:very-short-patch-repair endonuclease
MVQPWTVRARRLRRTQTYGEVLLWRLLRDRRLIGLKVRRQASLGPYTVDFACFERRLVVELDGGVHDAPFYDRDRQAARDAWLSARGFTVLRFRNSDVEHRPHAVIERILTSAGLPSPLVGEGVGGADG